MVWREKVWPKIPGSIFGVWPKIWASWPKMGGRVARCWAKSRGGPQGGRGGSPPQPFPCL